MPDTFFHLVLQAEQGVKLPPLGQYAVGMTFLPVDGKQREEAKKIIEATAAALGHETIAWRPVPVNNKPLGKSARAVEPIIEQWFVSSKGQFFHLNTEQQVRFLCLPSFFVIKPIDWSLQCTAEAFRAPTVLHGTHHKCTAQNLTLCATARHTPAFCRVLKANAPLRFSHFSTSCSVHPKNPWARQSVQNPLRGMICTQEIVDLLKPMLLTVLMLTPCILLPLFLPPAVVCDAQAGGA